MRKGNSMQDVSSILKNEEGSLIVIVLMILVMVTILGLTASTVSRTEVQISTNELISQRMFFTADSGIEHIRKQLQIPLAAANAGTTGGVNLTFALLGRDVTNGGGDDASGTNFGDGARWIDNADFDGDGMNYSVRVWNNSSDPGGSTSDTDSLVYARSVSTGPRGGTTAIEVYLLGRIKPGTARSITGYSGQEGAGSGKSYVSSDANAMSASALNTNQASGLLH